jgi:N-acetylated-alpha-linked acidic dipeptidase
MDMGLNGRGGDGTYHSTYDHPGWFKTFIDPQFNYSVLAAQATGVAVLRLADAQLLPLDYEAYGRQVREYIGEIETQAMKASASGAKTIDFEGLKRAADAFARAGADLRARGDAALAGTADKATLTGINTRLMMAERDLIEPAGLPDRPWYRHVIYAPGLYTGYGVKTIPGVREAVDAGNYTRAAEQAHIVIRALGRATNTLTGGTK